jgi:sterol desaturase/sphingolipid hydroxylase (fatty acid hydroxylase superfamily)
MDTDPLDSWSDLLRPLPHIFAFDYGRYLVAALLLTLVLALMGLRRKRRAVRTRLPEPGQKNREFRQSTLAAGVFALVGLGVHHGSRLGVFRLYDEVDAFGWGYWLAVLGLIVVAHDTYFYWTHRILHMRALFAWTHRTHHRSVAPTPWTAYSFSIAESLVHAAFLPLFLLFIPTHTSVLIIWMAHQILRNAQGHCGVELLPRAWLTGWWGRWLTTTLHHDLHHAHGRCNYGLYFTWWDRWAGTEHREYRARLQRLTHALHAPALAEEA